jgi:hypothetical protein
MQGSEVCHAHSDAAVGRPSALTPERHHQIVQLVKTGCPGEVAARAAGISPSTWYEIKKRGLEEDAGPCRELRDDVEQAQAQAYAHAMTYWRRTMSEPGNWRANVAYIDRFDRGRFDDSSSPTFPESSTGEARAGALDRERRLRASDLSDEELAELERAYAAAEEGAE